MKSILLEFFNQKKNANNSSTPLYNFLSWVNQNPVLFLWGIWTSYLCLDVIATLLLGYRIDSYGKMFLNFIGGGVINQFWFFVVLPNAFNKKKWTLPLSILILIIAIFLTIKYLMNHSESSSEVTIWSFLIFEMLRVFQFLIFTSALWGLFSFSAVQKEKMDMEIYLERLKIEHRALQLSPHFVLNMISQYAVSIMKLSKPLYRDLMKFTSLLSYGYKSLDRTNYLENELQAFDNYLECQQLRFGEKLNFKINRKLNQLTPTHFPLPKWIVMTLLENMFKHGNCFDSLHSCIASIHFSKLQCNSSIMVLSLTNPISNSTEVYSSDFGLSSIHRILTYYFGDDHALMTSQVADEFSLLLTITYHE